MTKERTTEIARLLFDYIHDNTDNNDNVYEIMDKLNITNNEVDWLIGDLTEEEIFN